MPKIADWCTDSAINNDNLITHMTLLENITITFTLMKSGGSIRWVVSFD